MENLLRNQVALITGAGRGIGKATALTFARAGASVVLAARTGAEILAVAEEIKAFGGKALAIPTDVTNAAAIDNLITLTIRAFRQVNILINNAGVIAPIGKTWEVDPVQWQRSIAINLMGPYLCARAVLPHMLDRGDGYIINVTSGAAQKDVVGWSAYCAGKAGLDRFTTTLASEVAHTGITVCSMDPGATDTSMQAEIRRSNAAAYPIVGALKKKFAENRLFKPEEVAQLLLQIATTNGHHGTIVSLSREEARG